MKKRWLINLVLLLLVAAIAIFLYARPKQEQQTEKSYELSTLKLGDFSSLRVEFPSKAPVTFEKKDGYWYMQQPYQARADQAMVQRILSIVAATSKEKFPVSDLSQFGLDNPALKVKMGNEEFLFGTYNPVSGEQYVAYKDAIYMVEPLYSESAATQPIELISKHPFKPGEKIAGFDLSRLEQWEDIRLHVDLVDGNWKISATEAKPEPDRMNEWLEVYWNKATANSVELYTPDRKATYPSVEVKLQNGSKVHFDKLQESPELLLGRPDEGILYHFPQDVGFTMLNPPIGLKR
ncbi:MAG TPA: DUF4340 domain-containing protein [Methylophilaceae bacterium]|nr:DUF4340 domain-containing protein [Methylophilaceae bacterium]HYG32161.1 DUF4340 domain-containing protein [Methylophilaceae bacterium]